MRFISDTRLLYCKHDGTYQEVDIDEKRITKENILKVGDGSTNTPYMSLWGEGKSHFVLKESKTSVSVRSKGGDYSEVRKISGFGSEIRHILHEKKDTDNFILVCEKHCYRINSEDGTMNRLETLEQGIGEFSSAAIVQGQYLLLDLIKPATTNHQLRSFNLSTFKELSRQDIQVKTEQ